MGSFPPRCQAGGPFTRSPRPLSWRPRELGGYRRRKSLLHRRDIRVTCITFLWYINLYLGNVYIDGCIDHTDAGWPVRTGWSRRSCAAHDLFAERGYAAVKMDEIAASVGVTKPLLYNYFGNKEQLYIACMERAGDSLTATVAEAVAASANPGEALGAGVRAFFAFLDSDRAAWAVLFDETLPAAARSPTASPTTAAASSSWSPARCWRSCPRSAATPPGSRSRPSPPPCSAPPRRWRAGGCGPRRSAPTRPPSC